MTELPARDYLQLLQIVFELGVPCTLEEFPHRVLALLPRLVKAESVAYNEVNLRQGYISGFIYPDTPHVQEICVQLKPHLDTHPVIAHVAATGDFAPTAISDFWTHNVYQRSAIYNECYRWLEVEDQLALSFGPEPGVTLALTLNRSRRSFSPRDRTMLALLRPHLTQAYLCAAQTTRLRGEMAQRDALWDAMDCGALLLRANGKVAFCSDKAAQWLLFYCGPDALRYLEVPAEVRTWLHSWRAEPLQASPLQLRRGDNTLIVRFGGNTSDGTLLLLDEHTATPAGLPDALQALETLGLTRRQSEVLLWLSQGESNAQIAARLDLSLHTVKRHLEAIFSRLDVQSRSAAAFCAQQKLGSKA